MVSQSPRSSRFADSDFFRHLCEGRPIVSNGKAVRWVATITDIHDLVTTKEEALRSQVRFCRLSLRTPSEIRNRQRAKVCDVPLIRSCRNSSKRSWHPQVSYSPRFQRQIADLPFAQTLSFFVWTRTSSSPSGVEPRASSTRRRRMRWSARLLTRSASTSI